VVANSAAVRPIAVGGLGPKYGWGKGGRCGLEEVEGEAEGQARGIGGHGAREVGAEQASF